MREYQPLLKQLLSQTVKKKNILPNLPDPKSTQIVRYSQILSYAKDLAKHASQSEEETQNVIQKLKKMVDEIAIIEQPEQKGNKIVYELRAKKKGRPKKSRIKPSFENSTRRKCKICQKFSL